MSAERKEKKRNKNSRILCRVRGMHRNMAGGGKLAASECKSILVLGSQDYFVNDLYIYDRRNQFTFV